MRVKEHPILSSLDRIPVVEIIVDGIAVPAREGESIAAALMALGRLKLRHTHKTSSPRGVFCGIGRCTDCVMTVDGQTNVRTCVTPVRAGMIVETQNKPDKGE
ncbi:dehydrogenase [Anaerosporomusa subterranea]|uniref:Dehydrogenase n=1 Tax=Anaerosporomusa subterranea TaxID=1794912 RepID=A0A154BQG2_ANASB|nr:(2Fe-2S)-binding protein [Anaerosporomusa subterranea]KYZ76095.1 dehydrogenase [Anaerosporomusa subterranea]